MKKENDTMTHKDLPLTSRYREAVHEFRLAYSLLAASDIRAGRSGFGPPPAITELRHSIANPNESGSLADDIKKVL